MTYLNGIFPVCVYGVSEECVGYFKVYDEMEATAIPESTLKTKRFKDWKQTGYIVLKSDLYGNIDALNLLTDEKDKSNIKI